MNRPTGPSFWSGKPPLPSTQFSSSISFPIPISSDIHYRAPFAPYKLFPYPHPFTLTFNPFHYFLPMLLPLKSIYGFWDSAVSSRWVRWPTDTQSNKQTKCSFRCRLLLKRYGNARYRGALGAEGVRCAIMWEGCPLPIGEGYGRGCSLPKNVRIFSKWRVLVHSGALF